MTFLLSHLTPLLTHLETLETSSLSASTRSTKAHYAIESWFTAYRGDIDNNPVILLAIFSILLPGLRCDRVYGLREDSLGKVLVRVMGLTAARGRGKRLLGWKKVGGNGSAQNRSGGVGAAEIGDFAEVVEKVMREAETSKGGLVTVEEIDELLDRLAGLCQFSSSELRRKVKDEKKKGKCGSAFEALSALWHRLTSCEAKWVIRVILRSMEPIKISETPTLSAYHFLLPYLVSVRFSLRSACYTIGSSQISTCIPPHPPWDQQQRYLTLAASSDFLCPEVGTKVGRGEFLKATSTTHAMKLAKGRVMVVERKYDGEYCQVHIDVTKEEKGMVRLFSKSGRDSTWDRIGIHSALIEAFRLTSPSEREISQSCILEGELVVFHSPSQRILPFHHLRRHIRRSGRYIGTLNDSPADPHSHLMILIFDILLLDNQSFLSTPLKDRRCTLAKILPDPVLGRVELAQFECLDFADAANAHSKLRHLFAKAIVKKWEGLILKPYDSIYVDLSLPRVIRAKTPKGNGFVGSPNAWIKLKKDYIPGLGDSADFLIVGACSDVARACTLHQPVNILNTFYAAVIVNKPDVIRLGVKPECQILFPVTYSINKADREWIQRLAYFSTIPFNSYPGNTMEMKKYTLSIHPQIKRQIAAPTHVFTHPLIFEIVGGGFDRPTDCNFYTPRHPRAGKIHWDRGINDAVGWSELQEMAKVAMNMKDIYESQEERKWIGKLGRGDLGAQLKETPRDADQESEETPSSALLRRQRKMDVSGEVGDEEDTEKQSPALTLERPNPLKRACTENEVITGTESPKRKLPRRHTYPEDYCATVQAEQDLPTKAPQITAAPSGTAALKLGSTETSAAVSISSGLKSCNLEAVSASKNDSPVTNAIIYLIPTLAKFPSLFSTLSNLGVGMIYQLNLDDSTRAGFSQIVGGVAGGEDYMKENKRRIVLVDPTFCRSDTRKAVLLLKQWSESKWSRKGSDDERPWEVYDWRVCDSQYQMYDQHGRVDWGFHRVCKI
ncbi:hypothetical protein EX30DRAFT_393179 [Ascodesmis nigricans]|uniref:ATP-dependent DNA ligase family profile domain-containing protein n=1 Tax=Ascodesmis nigricans TaxID=341454 RepID=A0A4S2N3C1_9PEZI|nr:hypothetical protein EX30DRAFT_393179 [Ascodesmis nigricans]